MILEDFLPKGIIQRLADSTVTKRYVEVGGAFGDAVSYTYLGECVGFKSMLEKWAFWEREYARRGYRTVSVDDLIGFGGYGARIDHLLGKREKNPSLHAEIYRKEYLGKTEPVIDLTKGEPQMAIYQLPTTKN
jgi:hypothetical protein